MSPECATPARTPPSPAAPATLVFWGQASPHGVVWMLGALGGHFWVGGHTHGLCRLETVANGGGWPPPTRPRATRAVARSARSASRSTPQANADGSHFAYVADNSSTSRGKWRLRFGPATETLSGSVLMASGSGLDSLRLADRTTRGAKGYARGPA